MWRIEILSGIKEGILLSIYKYDEKIRVTNDSELRRKYYRKIFDGYELLDLVDKKMYKIAYKKRDELEKIINLLKN